MALWRECGIECDETHNGDGFIQRYVHLTREFEASTSFHVFSLFAAVAAATSRRVVIDRGGYRLWPNLYILLHGPSGLGKGIASGHAMDLVRGAVGDMLRIYPEDITGEGLFKLFKRQTDAGESCVGIVYADEFGDLLGGQDYKSELAKRLTRIYSCPDELGTGRSGSGELWARDLFFNILGCSQEDWLRTLPLHAIRGGLFARIITVPEEKRRFRRYEPRVDHVLAGRLREELGERLGAVTPGVVKQTKEAFALGEAWYNEEDARWKALHPIVMPWCERRQDHAFKLGYVNTLLEGDGDPHVIDVEGLRWGLEAVETLTPRIQAAFLRMDESGAGELHRTVETMLVKAGGVMPESRMRAGLGHKWGKRAIDEAFDHLVTAGKVTRDQGVGGWMVRMASQTVQTVGD